MVGILKKIITLKDFLKEQNIVKYAYMCTENENSSYIVTVTKIIKKGENSPYSHNNKGFHERPDNFLNERMTIRNPKSANSH